MDGYGGVFTYVNSHIPCKRLVEFELPDVESLWLTIRPFRLLRAVSVILLGVVYQPPRNGSDENKILLEHIQNNADSFLCKHPDGLVVVCGDFNPVSTGITEQQTKLSTGLVQVIKVLMQDSGTLDWCLTNRPKLFSPPKQLPKIGTSDHYTVLMLPRSESSEKSSPISSLLKRDLRPSKVDAFGRWIMQHDWGNLFNLRSVKDKFDLFSTTMSEAMDWFFPLQRTKCCTSDKPWMTSKLKALILRRQKSLVLHGKDSTTFKYWTNRVQQE